MINGKNIRNVISIIAVSMLLVACPQVHDDDVYFEPTVDQILNITKNGIWEITYFYDSGHEETGNFSGYSFNFNEDGTLVAVNGNTEVTGTWSVFEIDDLPSDDDGSMTENVNKLSLFFVTPDEFLDLNKEWDIIYITENHIEVSHENGGNDQINYLTFNML